MTELSLRSLKAAGRVDIRSKQQMGRSRAAGQRDFTYTVAIDCGDGNTAQFVYILRGDAGSYREDWCGDVLNGVLSYVEDIVFEADGLTIPGFVYNGVDDFGTWGYFFSTDEVPELGAFLVMYGDEHVAGQPFNPAGMFLATRTSP
ncbi:hypothetical protein E2493_18665 [Sphingomonas parva]|uniref:Uncharacterized protein n=1 Tax=Sphingomonas parva TaxID=2555898 RepID=A0A4Y8ZL21_9SPHN|nr:hypothetical protein [Sphingomonas parva]TFI56326.1 hypothetical protein E2493_20735 [Sphingomonas parva]TFI56327.1 hypothetical protein E2493_20740 [Sphingomonas parva]TFI56703.1 hypothetical protein E2493_18660 [Sphingomonas parva]TFI56704.1 hypothetical protein E2493_18665 [Sphingomonas parva]